MALYRTELEGQNAGKIFDSGLGPQMRHRRRLAADLREAIESRAFEAAYQPLVDPVTARMRGFEALLRWRDRVRGLVPPSDFIPIAEARALSASSAPGW